MASDHCDVSLSSDRLWDGALYSDVPDCADTLAMGCRCDVHDGINLEMWTHHRKMKQVVNVIVALQKMKHIKPMSSEFGQDEVLNIIMDNVIEARLVSASPPQYCRTNRVFQCTVCDQYRKSLVRSGESPYLKAVTLKAGQSHFKVQFSMSAYASPRAGASSSQPVCLGISKSNFYLACTKSNDSSPKLVLKEISGNLSTITAGDPTDYDSLLFLRTETGVSINTFESVKYPGWFISTAFDDLERVEVTRVPTERITNFELEEQE